MKGKRYKTSYAEIGLPKYVATEKRQNIYIHARKTIEENKMNEESKKFINTPIICKQFGCGKKLNATEQLYGDYCFKHQQSLNQKTVANEK